MIRRLDIILTFLGTVQVGSFLFFYVKYEKKAFTNRCIFLPFDTNEPVE